MYYMLANSCLAYFAAFVLSSPCLGGSTTPSVCPVERSTKHTSTPVRSAIVAMVSILGFLDFFAVSRAQLSAFPSANEMLRMLMSDLLKSSLTISSVFTMPHSFHGHPK